MQKTVYFCDRCGKMITGNVASIMITIFNPENGHVEADDETVELCAECHNQLAQFLKKEEPKQESVPEPPKSSASAIRRS